jgi:hypothetical protein
MAHHDIELFETEDPGQSSSCAPDRVGTTQPNVAKPVGFVTVRRQFLTEPTVEAQGEARTHPWRHTGFAGKRHQERLDSPVQIAAVNVKNAHETQSLRHNRGVTVGGLNCA